MVSRDKLEKILIFSISVIISTTIVTNFPLAFADNVIDQLPSAAGPYDVNESITNGYKFQETSANQPGGDSIDGCNATVDNPVTVTISVVPDGVTVVPSFLIFDHCSNNERQDVIITPTVPGDFTISVSVSGGIPGGSYQTDSSLSTFTVISLDTTPPVIVPTIQGTLGNNGWYVSDVIVSWSVTDPESAITSSSGCDTTTIDYDTAEITLRCEATSAGGTSSESVTIKRDATPPTVNPPPNVTFAAIGTTGAADVTYDPASCDDNLSGLASCSSTPASGSMPIGLNTITHTATDNAGNTASATSTANVFDIMLLTDPVNLFSNVYVRVIDQSKDTDSGVSETVTFNVRSDAGDVNAQAGINVDATAQLPGTAPQSYYFENAFSSLVVTTEATDESSGKLNLGNAGYDEITVKYTTDGVSKEVSADTQSPGGQGRPATASDPFRWSNDRYLIESSGTVKAFESTKSGNGISDTVNAQIATSTSGTIDTATYYSVTLTEDPGDTGTFTSPSITFSSTLASLVSGGTYRLNTPAGATVYAKYTPLSGPEIRVTAAIDGLSVPNNNGEITLSTAGAVCGSFGGDTDGDGICNNWEAGFPSPGLFINQFPSAVYSYGCLPQIDDSTGNPAGSRYSATSADPAFVTTETTSYSCPTTNQRDIYIEIDYMTGHKPDRNALAKVLDVLAQAPDPDGAGPILPGIKGHIQLDENVGFHRDAITWDKTAPAFSDTYTTNAGWTQVSTPVTVDSVNFPDQVKFNAATSGSDKRVWKLLGFTLDNSQWKMESVFTPTAASSPNHMIYAFTAGGGVNPDLTSQDHVGVVYKYSSGNKLMLFRADGTATETFGTGITANPGSTYYIKVERLSATSLKLSVFSDSSRVVHVTGSPVTMTIPSTILNLNAIQHSVTSSGSSSASLTASIDDTNIYNGFNPGFQDLKKQWFGKSTERNQAGKTANYISDYLSNKRQIMHYANYIHNILGRECTSGLAEIGGNDLVVSLGCFSQNIGSTDEQAGTFMHELGHNLFLNHGGGGFDDLIGKPNYLSVMNYAFQFPYPMNDPAIGAYTNPLDFSRSALPPLDERVGYGLVESVGIGPAPQSPVITVSGGSLVITPTSWKSLYGPESGLAVTGLKATNVLSSVANNPVNWNRDADSTDVVTGVAIHNMPTVGALDSTPRLLSGFDDYAALDFNFRDGSFFGDGFSGWITEPGTTTASFTSDFDHDTPFVQLMTWQVDAFAKGVSQQGSALMEDPDGSSESYTAKWIWGDGSETAGTVGTPFTPADAAPGDETRDANVGPNSHSYSNQGRYQVSLQVCDNDSPTNHCSTTDWPLYTLVIDSSTRNRVSSSSTFIAPPGSYRSPTGDNDGTLGTTGPVTATFSSQYKSGKVSGSIGFNLKATDGTSLELKNGKVDWVVISDDSTGVPAPSGTLQAFAKGTATITGRTGTYGVIFSLLDNNPTGGSGTDAIRVIIWDPTIGTEFDNNAKIFDNECLDPDGSITGTVSCSPLFATPSELLTSGTVTIQ